MQAKCTHCGDVAQFVITYGDGLGVQVQEAACGSCADTRSFRDGFNKKRLSGVEVEF